MKVARWFDSNQDNVTPRNRLIFGFSLLLAGLFLYLAFRDLEWSAFFSILSGAQIGYLPIFLLWGSLSYVIRAYRWRTLLNTERSLSVLTVFFANMAGYLGNMVLPARAGELVRAGYLTKRTGLPISFAIATGLIERLMDVLALVTLGSGSLLVAGLLSSTLEAGLKIMGVIGGVGLISILILSRSAKIGESLVDRLPGLHPNQKEKIYSFIQNFQIGLASLSSLPRVTVFVGLTSLIWLMDAAGLVFLAYVLSLSLTLSQAFVLLAALGLSSAIPSTPGYVGVYQFAAVLVLNPFGFSNADAIALVLLAQIMNYVIIGMWGVFAIGKFSKNVWEPSHE